MCITCIIYIYIMLHQYLQNGVVSRHVFLGGSPATLEPLAARPGLPGLHLIHITFTIMNNVNTIGKWWFDRVLWRFYAILWDFILW